MRPLNHFVKFRQVILERLSDIIGFDLQRAGEDSSWLAAGWAATILIGFLFTVLFSRLMPPSDYGEYQFLLSVIAIMGVTAFPGLRTALTRAVAKGYMGVVRKTTKVSFYSSFIGTAGLLCVAGYIGIVRSNPSWSLYLLAALMFPFTEAFLTYQAKLRGVEDYKKLSILQVSRSLTSVSAAVCALIVTRNLLWIVGAYLLSMAVFDMVAYVRTVSDSRGRNLPGTIRYGFNLTFMEGLTSISMHLDKPIIAYLLGFEAVAIYSIALVFPEATKGLMKSVTSTLLPKFSQMDTETHNSLFRKAAPMAAMIVFLGAFLLAAAEPFIIPLFFGIQYSDAILPSQIITIGLIFSFFILVFYSRMTAGAEQKHILSYHITRSALLIVSTWVGALYFGIIGVAAGVLLVRFVSFGLLGFFVFYSGRRANVA